MGTHDQDLILVESYENGQVARVMTDILLDPMETEAIHRQLSAALAAKSPPNSETASSGSVSVRKPSVRSTLKRGPCSVPGVA